MPGFVLRFAFKSSGPLAYAWRNSLLRSAPLLSSSVFLCEVPRSNLSTELCNQVLRTEWFRTEDFYKAMSVDYPKQFHRDIRCHRICQRCKRPYTIYNSFHSRPEDKSIPLHSLQITTSSSAHKRLLRCTNTHSSWNRNVGSVDNLHVPGTILAFRLRRARP